MQTNLLGIIYKLFSIFGYSIIVLVNKGPVSHLNTFQVFFLSSFSCLLFVTAIIKLQRRESLLALTKSLDKTYCTISVINFASVCTILYAIKTLDITIVTSIGYLTPVVMYVLALVVFKETFSLKATLAVLISICGAVIIIRPVTTSATIFGILSAVISAIGWAVHGLILKKQTMRDHWTKQTFLTLILTSLLSLPCALITWQPLNSQYILIFLVLGILYTISKMFLVRGINRTPLTLLAPIGFMKLTFNAILAYLFFKEIITVNTIIGSSLIIFATVFVMYSTKKASIVVPQNKKINWSIQQR